MTDYDKLAADARTAKQVALIACQASDDGGSANLDATFYPLEKGQRSARVVAAFRAAGLQASETRWIGRGVMVQPPGTGQGNKRYASNQALHRSLSASGWSVVPYCQMD